MEEALFDQLPTELTAPIKDKISKLKKNLYKEGVEHFEHIISTFGDEEIYTLSFYYNAGSWSYILPTFATERGLEEIAQEYLEHSGGSLEGQKINLRWSPCDSAHHEAHGFYFSDDTDEILNELQNLTNAASAYIDESDELSDEPDADIAIIVEVHQKIHGIVIEALQQVALTPKVVDYRKKHRCLIVLEAGDTDAKILNQDLITLNGESVFDVIKSWD